MRLLPGLAVLRAYERGWWRPDLVAGATVGAMLVPQSMAYAELAGMPPVYGFYAVIAPLVLYALVGTSRHLGVGPEPGTAILAATGVGAVAAGDPDRYLVLMAGLALVVGAMAVLGSVARLGFIASVLSKPVLVGYITGVGLTLLSSQVAAFTGVAIGADRFFPRVAELARELGSVDVATLAVGAGSLGVVLLLRRWAPRAPGALVAVGVATLLVWALPGAQPAVPLVGAVPQGLPSPALPGISLADVLALVPVAAGIVLVGFTDNVLTARSIAARHGYRIDPNQELFALGVTNLSAGALQGFPVSSSASRTAVPAALGSRTQVVSLTAAVLVVATLLFLGPALGQVPRAALAAVIVAAALSIIDVPGYRALWRVSRSEALLAVVAALGVIVFDVLVGVLVAVALSVVVALGRMARPHDAVLGDRPELDGWVEVDAYPDARVEPGLLVYRFDAPLFFLNTDRFRSRVLDTLERNPGEEEWLVLDFEGVGELDATALDGLADLTASLAGLGLQRVAVARANQPVVRRLRRVALLAPEGPLHHYPTINAAVRDFRASRDAG
ncbi:SulP family inorganic anion transporter [Ornithinimicrobium pekingense]|uniref:Sodium-independent anion transporter n=1 Tax=Ornithinimicrobium pekingense TaxID=384677 RepID=A0ABQ2FAU6_9MICO|nr:SulP family inorganic anion transporter [Ornithinimicrobium pekingense]GGK74200.1 sodium-independent anion transporter [Ornithinimicrobium pekingense]